jgi:hypothetical protein
MPSGWPDEFVEKNHPKLSLTHFFVKITWYINFTMEKVAPKIGETSVIKNQSQ